ncbi:serine hydrolase domain-containing protein [Alteromonas oceanisediminis]|uniref:serine hydrolase domain-containing protein n=1 Tax=Alteromonas oceanisediminis TaxID=2836180 RepID=UPI001BDB284E|nr:serine hydrolase domain-containing protein [Alteromonas oceanisediminis]MBT0586138.1 beta-lactamase family protein [Alteromonas oceanisediminis]
MQKLLYIVVLSIGLSACGGSDPKVTPPATTDPEQFIALRSAIESDLSENDAGAVSVAIYQDGKVVFAEAFGKKVNGGTEAATPQTLFQLGSTTKMFTGLATLQFVEQGSLTIDDKLVNVLPNVLYPSADSLTWQDISIKHLLTHQSGLPDRYAGETPDVSLLTYMASTYPQLNEQMNPPGIFHNYSNPNWSYLGALVEYLAQKSFADYMSDNVFQPLGMTRTFLNRDDAISDGDYALGFQKGENEGYLTDINQIPATPAVVPAGSETWSTPTQQLKMAEFLLNGSPNILSNQLRSTITERHVDQEIGGLPLHYGFGIYVDDGFLHDGKWYPVKVWQHGGNTSAYTSLFWVLPEKKIAVSIMSSGGFTSFESSMLAALKSVTDLPSPQDIPFVEPSEQDIQNHLGTYKFGNFTAIIAEGNEELQITLPELDVVGIPYEPTLNLLGDATFLGVIENEQIQFTFLPITEGGESVYLRNRQFVGIKDGY